MVKPPKCRVCQEEHWSSEPHVFKEEKREVERKSHHVLMPDVKDALIDELRAKVRALEAKLGPKKDRKAYMRDYMRKRRAKS